MNDTFPWYDKMRNLSDLDNGVLLELRNELQFASDTAKDELKNARRVASRSKDEAGLDALDLMERRVRAIGRDILAVCGEFGRRRRIRHQEAQATNKARVVATRTQQAEVSTFERRFVDAAKLMLPARQFRDICRAASGVIDLTPNPERDQEVTPELSR